MDFCCLTEPDIPEGPEYETINFTFVFFVMYPVQWGGLKYNIQANLEYLCILNAQIYL